jgi:archaellum component FlaC
MKPPTTFPTPPNGSAHQRVVSDEKMEQVRQLLFGEFEQQTEGRVKELEARVRELEVGLHRRLDALQARLEALSGEIDTNQRTAHHEIATGLTELAERVRRISSS